MPIEDFIQGSIKQVSTSGAEGYIGSLYAQMSAYKQTNTGKRIRLEHAYGPSVSESIKDRYQMTEKQKRDKAVPAASDMLKPAQPTAKDMCLVEYDNVKKGGRLTGRHPSRGALVNVDSPFLSDDQVKAIFAIATEADTERETILEEADESETDDLKKEIGKKYNPKLRELLKGPMFKGHRLQKEALARGA